MRRCRRFSRACPARASGGQGRPPAPTGPAIRAGTRKKVIRVHPVRKPTWQQATALVSLSTCGAMTGFAFAHGTVDEMTSPTRMPVHLLALDKPARPASASAVPARDGALRSAIVKVASYYLRMAQSRSPAEMEAIIWGNDSVDGADHGQSCAAFASLTLALGAQAAGQESWVTGGTTYPWPLRQWADVRVDPNPASPEVVSVLQDAQAHHRWHPVGDGYRPQPGDWAMFDGHVEVVTKYSAGVLSTIGGDSGPNLSVNAHTFTGALADQGVTGFVNNGELLSAVSQTAGGAAQAETAGVLAQGDPAPAQAGGAAVPGTGTAALTSASSRTSSAGRAARTGATQARGGTGRKGTARMVGTAGRAGSVGTQSMVAMPGMVTDAVMATGHGAKAPAGAAHAGSSQGKGGKTARTRSRGRDGRAQRDGTAAIPGLQAASGNTARSSSAPATPSYTRNDPPAAHVPDTAAQQAFISEVAPGALAAQSRHGIPAAVTIAQAIDESGWGQSALAIRDHNLFGIKGAGPAGSDMLPTREYENGQWVTRTAPFRVYHNVAQSIADHGGTGDTGAATIPGVLDAYTAGPVRPAPAAAVVAAAAGALPAGAVPVKRAAQARRAARVAPRQARTVARAIRYAPQIPRAVTTAFISTAKAPLSRAEPLYDDVASRSGIRWELLAACDWMQCQAQPRYSPVYGEKLGTVNAGGTVYRTKSEALGQCASDLIELAMAVYWLDITARRPLSVRDLAKVFAAFRWGGLLKLHGISAMEFPYSVEGLTAQHVKMRWPDIREPDAPDRPGTRFRMPFGAVPVVLCLGYPALA